MPFLVKHGANSCFALQLHPENMKELYQKEYPMILVIRTCAKWEELGNLVAVSWIVTGRQGKTLNGNDITATHKQWKDPLCQPDGTMFSLLLWLEIGHLETGGFYRDELLLHL